MYIVHSFFISIIPVVLHCEYSVNIFLIFLKRVVHLFTCNVLLISNKLLSAPLSES